MRPATVSDPVLPHLLPEGNDPPPAEAVLFALRRIEAAFDAQSVSGSSKPCIPFPSARHKRYRLLTLAETRLKLGHTETFSELDPGWPKVVADELYRETRQETRTRKQAPTLKRLTGLVRKIVSDHDGAWTTLPSLGFGRWQIEVNHREEKTTFGVGQAQVRNRLSVPRQPAFTVAIYAMLLLAALKAYGPLRSNAYLPLPKWRRQAKRPSCLDIISQLRFEMQSQPHKLVDFLNPPAPIAAATLRAAA